MHTQFFKLLQRDRTRKTPQTECPRLSLAGCRRRHVAEEIDGLSLRAAFLWLILRLLIDKDLVVFVQLRGLRREHHREERLEFVKVQAAGTRGVLAVGEHSNRFPHDEVDALGILGADSISQPPTASEDLQDVAAWSLAHRALRRGVARQLHGKQRVFQITQILLQEVDVCHQLICGHVSQSLLADGPLGLQDVECIVQLGDCSSDVCRAQLE
mmetsp:Transcript_167233/g.537175  ORF Transcript_167233/g.537175 Transcript_167233/m.537175 type:complete len:213 (-) Transcript_167233:789-1427(-)